jgi:hypothetical protein
MPGQGLEALLAICEGILAPGNAGELIDSPFSADLELEL